MSFLFPMPDNEDAFEAFCKRLMAKKFESPSLQLYGKRGEKQDGVDVVDLSGIKPLRGWQSKHHPGKTLPPREIDAEVQKTTQFRPKLDEYYILTTGRKSTHAQRKLLNLNKDRPHRQSFETFIWTWDEIEGILSDLNDIERDSVLHGGTGRDAAAIVGLIREANKQLLAENTLVATDHVLQSRLEAAERHIRDENRQLAEYELEQIAGISTATTNRTNRYLIYRLNAKFLMLTGEVEVAAKRFLDAFNEQPELEQARINRAIAYGLLGNTERAFELATELKKQGVRSEPIPALLLQTSPKPIAAELHAWLEDFLDTSEELNLSYAMQHLDEGNLEEVLKAADRVKRINSKSSRAELFEAMVFHNRGVGARGDTRNSNLEQAYEKYNLALGDQTDDLPERSKPDALRNLSSVQFLLGRDDPKKTFEAAIEKARDKAPYIGSYLNYLCSQEDYEAARSYLAKLAEGAEFEDEQFLRNVIEYNTNADADKPALIQSMFELGQSEGNNRRMECLVFAVQWSTQSQLVDTAINSLESSKDSTDALVFHTCLTWLKLEKGEKQKAKAEALVAQAIVTDGSDAQVVSLLGRLLMRLDAFDVALPLFEQIADQSKLSDDTRALLDCAMKTGKHDVALAVCEKLRTASSGNSSTFSLEIELLGRYSPTKALDVLDQALNNDPANKWLYACRCFVQTRLKGRVDDLDISRLPGWNEIAFTDAHLVLFPLIAANYHKEAIDFAYAQLRENWAEELAHGRYMWLFLQFASGSGLKLDYTKVENGCAVHYQEEGDPIKTVLIDGDSAEPLAGDEKRPDSDFGQLLMGAKVGAEIELTPGGVQPRKIKIVEIQSKYIYRYQDVLHNMQIRFPGTSAIQMIQMEHEGEFDISPIVKSLEERRKYVDQVLEEFKRLPAATAFLAKWLGLSFYEAHESLTMLPDIGIRCCLGRSEGLETALTQLRAAPKLVLDQSAIVTIHNLGLWEKLSGYELIVARSIVDDFNAWVRNLEENGLESGGTTYLDEDGQLRLIEFMPEQVADRKQNAKRLQEAIQSRCQILESRTLPSLPEAREYYEELEAIPILESLLLTKENTGAVLLADDVYVHWAAGVDHGLSGIWTQVLLDELKKQRRLKHGEYVDCNAKLVGWRYNPIRWDAETALAAFVIAEYDARRYPFTAILREFASSNLSSKRKSQTALHLFRLMYHSEIPPIYHGSLVFSVLEAINDVWAADRIRMASQEEFLPYHRMGEDLSRCIQVWDEHRKGF
ncbi:MAG: hypothetical protein IT422_21765 [Pirellulaceae bacterium]|nr:hypothetical protein [Pirellulaceae bacterium]